MATTQLFSQASNFLKVLSDMTRLRICFSLFDTVKNVGQIANELNMSVSSISHQLRILKHNQICRAEKRGKEIYYELSDSHVKKILMATFEHMDEK